MYLGNGKEFSRSKGGGEQEAVIDQAGEKIRDPNSIERKKY